MWKVHHSLVTVAAVALLAPLACSQAIDNTLYVKQFPGVDVGAKVSAAQRACNPDIRVPCILVLDPSLATAAAGTMPALCSQCVLADYRGTAAPFLAGVKSDGANGITVQGAVSVASISAPGLVTTAGGKTFAAANTLTGLPSGCQQLPCVVAGNAPTLYSTLATYSSGTIFTVPAGSDRMMRFCAFEVITVAGTAGTTNISAFYVNGGHTTQKTTTTNTNLNTQWADGYGCIAFSADASSSFFFSLYMSSATGTPTVKYSTTLEMLK